MKKWNKYLALALCIAMAVMAVGCGSDNGGDDDNDAAAGNVSIGIIQYVEHVALDQAREGFIQALADNGYAGDNVNFDIQNAQADNSNLSTISQRFVNNNVDLVLAIATPAAQSMAQETTEIPILGTAVTDYASARLVEVDADGNALDLPGLNITGTSDMNPISDQIDLLVELVPDAKTVGIVYSSDEDNSILQAELAKEACEALGLSVEVGTVTTTNDVQQVTASIASKVDAIYIPTDNIYAASMPVVSQVTLETGVPTICGESGMVMNGGFATLGINYYELGYQTGLMAVKILDGEADPATMPIEFATGFDFTINGEMAEALGIDIPAKYNDAVVWPSDDTDVEADTEGTNDEETPDDDEDAE